MKTVFDKPFIFDGEDEVILIYSNYIISHISKADADLSIEKIDNKVLNDSLIVSL